MAGGAAGMGSMGHGGVISGGPQPKKLSEVMNKPKKRKRNAKKAI